MPELFQMALPARLEHRASDTDRRNSDRWTLGLRVSGVTSSAGGVAVMIHNISESGLLIETDVDLDLGTLIDIDLPEVGPKVATIKWSRDQLYGCEFNTPVTKAGLGAALLKSFGRQGARTKSDQFQRQDVAAEPGSDKLPMRTRLAVIIVLALACWAALLVLYELVAS